MTDEITYPSGDHQLYQIPIYEDNYVYLLAKDGEAVVVDPGLAAPVNALLDQHQLRLTHILNTHHHWDHVTGNRDLIKRWGCEVLGSDYDRDRIPGISQRLNEGDRLTILDLQAKVIYIPGHTLGHIAYFFPDKKWLFSGDTIFSLGCGRLFEGTAQQMQNSLSKLKSLPDETLIFCTHEYTETNLRFHRSIFQNDPKIGELAKKIKKLRAQNQATVPMTLAQEKDCNLMLRWNDPLVRDHFHLQSQTDWQVFAHLRKLRDSF